MKVKYIEAAIDAYRCIPGINEADHAGVSEEQIAKLEGLIRGGYRLPAAYKEFLKYAGNAWKTVYQNTEMHYSTAWRNAAKPSGSWAGKFQPDEEDARFPDNVFVIDEGSGTYFQFIKLDEGDDPPVYMWTDSMDWSLDEAEMEAPSFSVFLHSIVALTRLLALSKLQGELARKTGTLGTNTRTPPIDIPKPEPGIQAAIDTVQAIPGIMLEPRVGCTQAEIDALEAYVSGGRKLPFAYREFLAYAGHQWGALPLSASLNYGNAIAYAQNPEGHWPLAFLRSIMPSWNLPKHYLVIDMGADSFSILNYDDQDDPMVWNWQRDDSERGHAFAVHPNFSVFLHHMAGMEKLAFDRQHRQGG